MKMINVSHRHYDATAGHRSFVCTAGFLTAPNTHFKLFILSAVTKILLGGRHRWRLRTWAAQTPHHPLENLWSPPVCGSAAGAPLPSVGPRRTCRYLQHMTAGERSDQPERAESRVRWRADCSIKYDPGAGRSLAWGWGYRPVCLKSKTPFIQCLFR